MQVLESPIELQACSLVWRYLGIKGSKLKVLGDTSYPDRLFWVPGGRPLLIEFKRPGEPPEPKQSYTHNWLRSLGYEVQVHDSALKAFKAVIDHVSKTKLSKPERKVLERALKVYYVRLDKTNV